MTASAAAADISPLAAARDMRGRFRPGCSGNPAGKSPGTLNEATLFKRIMAEGDEERIGRLILDRALTGEWAALRFVFDRLEPTPRARPIALDFPENATVAEMSEIVLRAMAAGEISPDEALRIARFLDMHGKHRAGAAAAAARRPADPPAAVSLVAAPAPVLHSTCISTPPLPPAAAAPATSAPVLHSTCISTPPLSPAAAAPATTAPAPHAATPAWPATISTRRRRASAAAAAAAAIAPLAPIAALAAGAADLHFSS
jgi:hypothetical protein